MNIKNVKGGYDFLPKEERLRNYIKETLISVFKQYGYEPIETPILSYLDVLIDKYDENNDIVKEIYRLKDQGDRDLGLRYDLTVPFAKFVSLNKNSINMPFRRYEISKVFRDGPVKVGRDREFTQCDVDVVGLEGQMIEAELLQLYVSAFKKLDIDITIKYNSRNLIFGLVIESGIEEKYLNEVITIIDKFEKMPREELYTMLKSYDITDNSIEKLFSYLVMNVNTLNDTLKDSNNEYIIKGLKELSELSDYIENSNLSEVCVFTPTLVRGQNYYTGNVFEVYEKNLKIRGSIGGGGRYDNMITEFIDDNEFYPTVGISFGLTSIFELLKNTSDFENDTDLLIIPMETNIESLKLANILRENKIKTLIEMENKKIGKSLKFADKNKIKYTIVYGKEEVDNSKFNIKNMQTGQSIEFSNEELNLITIDYINSKFE